MSIREPIWSALWSMVTESSAIAGQFNMTARILTPIENIEAEWCPALFLLQRNESWVRPGKGIPAKRTLRGAFVFYVSMQDPNVSLPATLINNALDTIDELFNTPRNAVQTLGGLVEHAYIAEGDINYYEGLLQNKSAAIVPINILIP